MKKETFPQLSADALCRYQVVSELAARLLRGATKAEAIREVMALPHCDLHGRPQKLSERSLYRWLEAYQHQGIQGLETARSPPRKASAVLAGEFLQFLRREKTLDPDASVPELIERARASHLLADQEPISRITVWRACRRMGLPLRRARKMQQRDMRRFSYPHRMLMGLVDGKHFRAGPGRLRRVALCWLDDATRYGLTGLVGTCECTELFLHALHRAVGHHGLMRALYLDHGPGFISGDTAAVLARLGIHLIHGTASYPEGHGKIERFNRTLKHGLLRGLDGHPEVDADPKALTLRLQHWIREVYNHKPHEALGQSPAERWAEDSRPLEYPQDPKWLEARFLLTCERTVSNDNIVRYDGQAYEMPRGYAGRRILLTRHLLTGELSICHARQQIFLHPPDLEANAYSRRDNPRPCAEENAPHKPLQTAAHRNYQADFEPLVGPDGSFPEEADHE